MNYSKPEVTEMGPASLTIQGSFTKGRIQDANHLYQVKTSDCELDD